LKTPFVNCRPFKDRQVEKQIMKNAELWNQLDAIKLKRTREVWLLKKEIEIWRTKTNPCPRHTKVILSRVLYEFVQILLLAIFACRAK
jgi:hypothetical protein